MILARLGIKSKVAALFTLTLYLMLATKPVVANEIQFQTQANNAVTLSGETSVNKLGVLLADKALAIISANHIKVQSKDKSGNSKTLVSGLLIKVSVNGRGKARTLSGFIIADKQHDSSLTGDISESINTASMGVRRGQISSVSGQSLTLSTTGGNLEIAFEDILDISSPRAYKFKLKLANVAEANLAGAITGNSGDMEILFSQKSFTRKQERISSGVEYLAIAGGAGMSILTAGSVAALAIPLALINRGTSRVANSSLTLLQNARSISATTQTTTSGLTSPPSTGP